MGPGWLSDRAIREQSLSRLLGLAGPQDRGVAGQRAGRGGAGSGERCLQEEQSQELVEQHWAGPS